MKPAILTFTIAAAAMFAPLCGSAAQDDASLFKVTKLKVSHHNSELSIAFDVDPRLVKPGRDREVVFTPVLRSLTSADSLELPTVKLAGRNRYYSHLRNGDLADGDKITLAGSNNVVEFREDLPFEQWMTHSRLVMREDVGNCCDAPVPVTTTPVAELNLENRPVAVPFNYVALVGDSAITRKAEGRAFVNFVVNRTELKPDYMDNPKEIAKILESIKPIQEDPDAIITRVTIKGYASPEGSYSNNVRLAMGRTQTLKEYVRSYYNFPSEIMATDYEPEDWEGLREWLLTCNLPHRAEIIEIVDSKMEPDPKNAEIQRRYPQEYATILKDVYPWLRHSDYTIQYSFKTYTDINEIRRLFNEAPDKLRPIDFQRLAATYEAGTPEFEQVYLTAVRIHPNDELANINAANIAMAHDNLRDAADYLKRAGSSPEALYTRGVYAARMADYTSALNYLRQAGEMGVTQAADAIKAVEQEMQRERIDYFITPQNSK